MVTAILVSFSTLGFLLLSAEIGYHLGHRNRDRSDQEGRSQISMVEGALLGVLGLLLGFTFSMAVARYDARQELVVREANALGTLYLRCNLLPEPARSELRSKLREYADLRVNYGAARADREKLDLILDKCDRLQPVLWALAGDEARQHPTLLNDTLLSSMTEAFDLAEARRAALENHVPLSVWIVLYIVAALAAASLGLGSGLTGRRVLLSVGFVPLLLAVILTLLVDLAHPRKGLIVVSEATMVRLRAGMK